MAGGDRIRLPGTGPYGQNLPCLKQNFLVLDSSLKFEHTLNAVVQ